ncbi:hypothetical protein [Xenorhabdus bovienii]|uniref:Putative Lipoprotein n=1 Tax=Xenorhabdus bovienii str. Intermedium TaxID=1379677 RepID=A0A077QIQ7_XENBV|nr:hypothetical protein [Xenorhabdus bovienii]MDE9544321.1 hypothetical protein [Xenorhabdus bovienii]CDH32226.1 putative Lipoprotein [Xenorhabdus bovienii str. Intermedium]
MRILMMLVISMALTGCVTNAQECDPTTGDMSIITKFNCNYSGTWDQRVVDKEKVLQHEQTLNKEFKAVYDAIEREKKAGQANLESRKRSQVALQKSLNRLFNQLKTKAAGKVKIEKQIVELEKRMREAQQKPSQSEMQKQLELQQLQNQLNELQDSLMIP